MAIVLNDNLQNNSPKSLDNKYLKNGTTAYTSVSDVNTTIVSAYRSRGLTVCINVSGTLTEYWYRDGIADGDLVAKDAFVPTSRTITTLPTISGGGALSSNLTLAVVDNTSNQKIGFYYNSSSFIVGTRKAVNFIPGTNVTMSVVDDSINDWASVTVNATGGGGGGEVMNSSTFTVASDTTTVTIGGLIGLAANKVFPIVVNYMSYIVQTSDPSPAAQFAYLNTATGEVTFGVTISAGSEGWAGWME